MNQDSKKVFYANSLYMLTAALLLVLGTYVQQRDLIKGLYITEWLLVLMPALLYMKVFKVSYKEIRLKPLKTKDGIITVLITIFLYPVILFMNITFLFILKLFLNFEFFETPIPTDFTEYLIYIPAIAISAGICEEFFFRGIMLSQYGVLGRKNAIVFSALLFGIFHFNFQNLVGPVILGLVFGYLVYRTGSIFAAILAHITNNLFALTLGYIMILFSDEEVNMPDISIYDIVGGIIMIGILALICIVIIKMLISKMSDEGLRKEETDVLFISEIPLVSWVPVLIVSLVYLMITIGIMIMR